MIFAVWPVLESSPNIFSAAVQLSEGIPLVLLANWAVAVAIVIGKLLQQLMFGELRLLEIEHIYERSKFEVINSLIALTMFNTYWLLIPGILTLVLLFVKVFHWLLNDRFEMIFQRATTPRDILMTRNTISLLILLYTDFTMVYSCAEYTFGNTPDVYFAFGFEFALLFIKLLSLTMNICLNTWEVHYLNTHPDEEVMESKELYLKIVKLVETICSLAIYHFLVFTFIGPNRIPIYLAKDTIFTAISLVKQVKEMMIHLKTAKELDSKLLDATEEELNEDNNLCIICRDDMTTVGVTKGERLYPKKLPCNHIIHLGCLKGWLEISQVCPLCRGPVFVDPPVAANNQQQQQQEQQQQQHPVPQLGQQQAHQEPERPQPEQREAAPMETGVAMHPNINILDRLPNGGHFFHSPTETPTATQTQSHESPIHHNDANTVEIPTNGLNPPGWTLFNVKPEAYGYRVLLNPTQEVQMKKILEIPRDVFEQIDVGEGSSTLRQRSRGKQVESDETPDELD